MASVRDIESGTALSLGSAIDSSKFDTEVTTSGPKEGQVERFFDFFGLPRELRDMIYKECLDDISLDWQGRKHNGPLAGAVRGLPAPDILLVNHQFSSECRDAEQGLLTLILREPYIKYCPYLLGTKSLWDRIAQLDIQADMEVEWVTGESFNEREETILLSCTAYAAHISDISPMLPSLCHLKLMLFVFGDSDLFDDEVTILPAFHSLIAIPKLVVLKVYDYTDLSYLGYGWEWRKGSDVTRKMYTWKMNDPILRRHENPDHTVDGQIPCGVHSRFDIEPAEPTYSFVDGSSSASSECGQVDGEEGDNGGRVDQETEDDEEYHEHKVEEAEIQVGKEEEKEERIAMLF